MERVIPQVRACRIERWLESGSVLDLTDFEWRVERVVVPGGNRGPSDAEGWTWRDPVCQLQIPFGEPTVTVTGTFL